ncbi:DUF6529 family protein [Pseudonocardia alni]|uniref:Uncharacterized protein n=1 Tax=Pseudonocardia alni TaxID=33907 RepID=A0AA44UQZ9_PSEA5|nr:DUF6529 family protein [Pseudonocardia alni]PKB31919.1 hypothetical protein ATL51_3622 [Pseudonocardia alni]
MSPRARHADRELTDPVGFAPVSADIPNPRGPEHSGGWAAVAEPSWAPDHDPGGGADRWAGTADRRRDAVAGDLFTPTGPLTPPPGGGSGTHGVATPRRPAPDAGAARPGRPRRAAGDDPPSAWSAGADDTAWSGSTPGRSRPAGADRLHRSDDADHRGRPAGTADHPDAYEPLAGYAEPGRYDRTGYGTGDGAAAGADVRTGAPAEDPAAAYRERPARPARPAVRDRADGDDGPARRPGRRGPGRRRSRATAPDPARARRRPDAEAAHDVAVPAEGLSWRVVAVPVVVGSLVAVALGVWARQHVGTGVAVNLAGFSSGAAAKAWLGSAALVLAVVQGVTGRMMMRGYADPVTAVAHRWSGRAAVLVTVPVAVQCLYAFGWSGATTSALLHSALGCLFYGAFVTKMLLLRRPGVPGWLLAVAGGVLLAVLAGVWSTSALWFFAGHGLSF